MGNSLMAKGGWVELQDSGNRALGPSVIGHPSSDFPGLQAFHLNKGMITEPFYEGS